MLDVGVLRRINIKVYIATNWGYAEMQDIC